MIFEVGKCYEHATGQKIRILCEVDTHFYGHGLMAETDEAKYYVVGIGEDYAVNWKECKDFARRDVERENVLYVCNGQACENCHSDVCHHTSNIAYAKNFEKDEYGHYVEKLFKKDEEISE